MTLEASVLRRLLFAAIYVPEGTPNRWELISTFAFQHATQQCSASDVQLLLENIKVLDSEAFSSDAVLMNELHALKGSNNSPLGIILISPHTVCKECGGKLLTRVDRPSNFVVYSEAMGTVPATHIYGKTAARGANSHNIMAITQRGTQVTAITMKTGTL